MQENFQIKKSIQERIIEILEYENITPYKFCKDLGFSQGYLDKRGAIGTDKYLKIIKYLKNYNPMWILNEEEPLMINKEDEININDIIWQELADDRKYTIEIQKEKINNLEDIIDRLKKAKEPSFYPSMVDKPKQELKKYTKK